MDDEDIEADEDKASMVSFATKTTHNQRHPQA